MTNRNLAPSSLVLLIMTAFSAPVLPNIHNAKLNGHCSRDVLCVGPTRPKRAIRLIMSTRRNYDGGCITNLTPWSLRHATQILPSGSHRLSSVVYKPRHLLQPKTPQTTCRLFSDKRNPTSVLNISRPPSAKIFTTPLLFLTLPCPL